MGRIFIWYLASWLQELMDTNPLFIIVPFQHISLSNQRFLIDLSAHYTPDLDAKFKLNPSV
jgi:hypothetical protein